MHQPGTRIVSHEGEDQVAVCGQRSCVAVDWVGQSQGGEIAGPSARPLANNIKAVAVEMNRMGERRVVGGGLDHPVLPLRTMRRGLRFRILGMWNLQNWHPRS